MGKLIVLEGLDGSGKGTQTHILAKKLQSMGKKVKLIDFPNYSSEGSALVRMYLGGELGEHPDDTNAYAASMFYAADRYVSYVRDWKNDYLDSDTVIIANRYTTANAYHQLSKMPEDRWEEFLTWLWDFEFGKLGLPSPDKVVFLDMPESVSSALVKKRSEGTGQKLDIHEKDKSYLVKCRSAAKYAAEKYSWSVVECAAEGDEAPRGLEEISADVYEEVKDIIFTKFMNC